MANPLAPPNLSMFDLARWKPIKNDEFLIQLALIIDAPEYENISKDSFRLIFPAPVLDHSQTDDEGNPRYEKQPYLMLLYRDEKSVPVAFARTDADFEGE